MIQHWVAGVIISIMLGPFKVCESALVAKNLGMEVFSPVCAGPSITQRGSLFDNLHSLKLALDVYPTIVMMCLKYIGDWGRIGVLTSASNPNFVKLVSFLINDSIPRVN